MTFQAGGRRFESCRARQLALVYSGHMGDSSYDPHEAIEPIIEALEAMIPAADEPGVIR